jgi:DNA-binding NarL/FixJ family response regulator
LPKTSVLLVDDHEAIRRTLRLRFEALPDFVVCGEAVNGVDAVERAQQFTPDVVILDFAMPDMNGLEAATALKFMLPAAKLYLLTAHSNRELELAARDAGINAVFSKYEDLSTLLRRVRVDCLLTQGGADESKSTNDKSANNEGAANTSTNDKSSIH